MSAYYNEIDGFCVEWLKELMKHGLIADGVVDPRPIQEVQPEDLDEFTQCHFFAGIAGWSYAARLAGWPDERQIWTGSCPCQPFSLAGKGLGASDPRHLWPDFFRLIRACRPSVVMGEQTSASAGYAWLDGVGTDLDSEDYTWRAVDIPVCSIDAPHIRNRLYWLAEPQGGSSRSGLREGGTIKNRDGVASGSGASGRLGQSGRPERGPKAEGRGHVDDGTDSRRQEETSGSGLADPGSSWMEYAKYGVDAERSWQEGRSARKRAPEWRGLRSASNDGFWDEHELVGPDPKGKYRRVKSGVRLLAHGVPGRVGKLRGYGNAINPELAAEVIRAYMDCEQQVAA